MGTTISERLIPAKEMPERIPGTTVQGWAQLRHKGTGPKFVKIGSKVYYDPVDIDAWLAKNTYQQTGGRK